MGPDKVGAVNITKPNQKPVGHVRTLVRVRGRVRRVRVGGDDKLGGGEGPPARSIWFGTIDVAPIGPQVSDCFQFREYLRWARVSILPIAILAFGFGV